MFQNEKRNNLKNYFGEKRSTELEEALLNISSSINFMAIDNVPLTQAFKKITEKVYLLKQIVELNVWDIFKLIQATFVANTDASKRFCESRAMSEKEIINLITVIKLLSYVGSETNSNSIDEKFKLYVEVASACNCISLRKQDFVEIYKAANFYELDQNWIANNPLFKTANNRQIADIFNNQLMETKAQQFKYLAAFYDKTTIDELLAKFRKSVFINLSQDEWKNKLNLIKRLVIKEGSPLDILCIVAASKKTTMGTKTIPANDTMLECTLIYNIYKNSLDLGMKSGTSCVVVGCSPFFIKKWAQDEEYIGYPVTFVVENADERDVLRTHFQNARYSGTNKKEIEIESLSEFANQVTEQGEFCYRNILVIGGGISEDNRARIRNLFLRFSTSTQRFFYFGGDEDLVKFAEEIGPRNFDIKTGCLIPSGLVDVTAPKYKTFWLCESKSTNTTKIVQLHRAIKVSERSAIQNVLIRDNDAIQIDMAHLIATGKSLRREYKDVESGDANRTKRIPAQRVLFSPEIEIWYNISSKLEDSDHEKTRAEAYICKNDRVSKSKNENLPRGKKIEASSKHVVSIKKSEVSNWAKYIYPFSVASGRNTSESKEIRRIISSEYRGKYEAQSGDEFLCISFRTAWYIFHEIENQLSGNEIQMLHSIAMGPLGELNIWDATADEYADALENYEDSLQNIKAINLISVFLDFAVRKGLCSKNVIDGAIKNESSTKRQFTMIRSSLTKKSFTLEELYRLLSLISKEIEDGNWEYIGVLIRLCTGLPGNIVCALNWDDYAFVRNYGFHQLLIYQQMINDGMEYKLLASKEDNRCLPVCSLLNEYLQRKLKRDKELFPESYRNRLIIAPGSNDSNEKIITPIELAQICKTTVLNLGIKEEVISIPDSKKGTIETDLSRYAGDIFRSNYVFWSTKVKFTADEICYLIGNKTVTTLGTHYIDYMCDDIQLLLYAKQERIFNIIQKKSSIEIETVQIEGGRKSRRVHVKGPMHARICIEATCNNENNGNVEIKSNYGFSLHAKRK